MAFPVVVVCQGKEQIWSGGDWGLGGSFTVHPRAFHAIFTFPFTPFTLYPPALLAPPFIIKVPSPLSLKHLLTFFFLSFFLFAVDTIRSWHIFRMLCWTPGSGTVMTEMWVTLQCTYCNFCVLIPNYCQVSLKCAAYQNTQPSTRSVEANVTPLQLSNPPLHASVSCASQKFRWYFMNTAGISSMPARRQELIIVNN